MAGLRAAGYEIEPRIGQPGPGDILVIWNRTASRELEAQRFEIAGARVLVCENGYLGKEWRGLKWFAMAWGHHAGAGTWPDGGSERWDAWNVELAPWRAGGRETVILAQRGIGEPGIASPPNWASDAQSRIGGRIRQHPGADAPRVPLAEDLKDAAAVVTFHSAAALKALILGVPVWHAFDRWIGARAARPLAEFGAEPKRDDADRLAMFRRLAWAMWSSDEVENGTAFTRLRDCTL
ncbi:hypothetical protein [Variovorax sp. JS1663]|uniref:hypothetical protein n=1 Tax=Variovorax sp. JS1663 TaxID=1851577 RepID=UPI00117EA0E4|nr:hypothetical protein [Variovorax sp. JS1663]